MINAECRMINVKVAMGVGVGMDGAEVRG